MTSRTTLVTGATGNIGSAILKNLAQSGVPAIAGSPSGISVHGAPGRVVDYNDVAGMTAAFEGVEALFLLFPLVPNKVQLATNALNAAKAAGVKYVVRSSGAGADPRSPMAIGRLQGTIDQLVIDSGISYTIVRPSFFMQNFVAYYAGMIKSGSVSLSHADGKISLIDVADIAAVDAVILSNPSAHAGQIYTITGPEAVSTEEALELISNAISKHVEYFPIPEATAVESMRKMGMEDWTVDIMSSLNQVVAAGYAAGISPTVKQLTGREPQRFEQFVSGNVSAWR